MDVLKKVSKISFLFICFVATVLFIFSGVFTTMMTFGLNPFKEGTATFLYMSIASLIGLSVVALMLNVASNLSLIAEVKSNSSPTTPDKQRATNKIIKYWLLGTITFTVLIVAAISTLNSLSESRKLKVVETQATEVLNGNSAIVEKIALELKTQNISEMSKISLKLDFLKKQRQNLPDLVLIYSDTFEGQLAFRMIDSWSYNIEKTKETFPLFSCSKNVDCEQLKTFFESGVLKSFSVKQSENNEYSVYYPYELNGVRFVLMFNKGMRFGSVGKY